ncbi:isoprenyl transferase [Arcticibacterium luteifluviistationis]|uniref:Isoprenyl transferase n=2 Tax=Arcticibacterium luteifluviistationis TaxID=1784714 RepID=A0A2Z4GIM9_9BACT|nr:isoprenyl transferase [Arcticibacterium luteifluviistationis]AWW00896.1 isoprenyl transferase [Arcticibacterium luteifluviistationis]
MDKIDKSNLPKHIAVIMDGNGRWAKKQGAMRIFGHHHGIKAVRETVEACGELGIQYLTLYTFSTENWSRPKIEVDGIMKLLVSTIGKEIPDLNKNNVRLKTIGDLDSLPNSAREEMLKGVKLTESNTGLTLNLALSYSGRWDIVQAVKEISSKVKKGEISIDSINEASFSRYLATEESPEVDLLVRTGGDHRISNYLLWQSAYAELLFMDDIFWPEFRKKDLFNAVYTYQQRERRFGKTGDQVKKP